MGNYRVYNKHGEYLGALVHAEDAAMLLAAQTDGAFITDGLRRWEEGKNGRAGESYDAVAEFFHREEEAI